MTSKASLLRKAWSDLTAGGSFVLACHERPDGDALGSALALAHVLRQAGKDVVVLSEDGVPEMYHFIPESGTIVTQTTRRDFDVGVLVDSEAARRVRSAAEAVTSARVTACVDHHVPDGEFGRIRIVDQRAGSTSEVVMELLDANDISIDETAATQLMTGLVADTGGFRFGNTSSRTFRYAARLTDLGARAPDIARKVYESRAAPALKLLGRALESLTLDETGAVAWAVIRKADMDEFGCTDADTDGIVNSVGWVRGPKVAILFREVEPASIRISLRSNDRVDVDRIARAFGGGGHAAAAGCTLAISLDDAIRSVLDEVHKWTGS